MQQQVLFDMHFEHTHTHTRTHTHIKCSKIRLRSNLYKTTDYSFILNFNQKSQVNRHENETRRFLEFSVDALKFHVLLLLLRRPQNNWHNLGDLLKFQYFHKICLGLVSCPNNWKNKKNIFKKVSTLNQYPYFVFTTFYWRKEFQRALFLWWHENMWRR